MKEVNLKDAFAKKLGMRTTAKKLFDDIQNEKEVILNFKDIEFMSRSFAQEYVFQKYNSNVEITEENMNDFVKGLLEVDEDDYRETCLS
ncbi:MAG: DUF4325 domain-containing protein [Methanobrevibacter millerae]|uniref:DUF4325 domain-containing protein n=1 Tax=Methanobrevibacter millerae TaxID=230361 RepID=A0A8T3VGN0_9EURY|nr:DUF4325 domain-containing protein [Methanobrevibacter millerae]MBE6505306.1 DUF4325 domain-containing protein [Methanobrevibacter millerae]